MRINICCYADIRMSEIILYVDELHTIFDEQTGACVPQVVEADFTQTVLFKQSLEVGGHGIGQE